MALRTRIRDAMSNAGRQITQTMEERPVLSNSIVCFKLWVLGDLLAQSYEKRGVHFADDDVDNDKDDKRVMVGGYDVKRTAQAALYGAIVTGPVYGLWFPFLDRQCKVWNVAERFHGNVWAVPATKVFMDEFIMDPPSISLFFCYMEYVQNDMIFDWSKTRTKLESEVPRAWLTSLVVWPVVLLGTFRFVPTYFQSAVVNMCAIVWDGFLSHRNAVANDTMKQQEHQQQQQNAKTHL